MRETATQPMTFSQSLVAALAEMEGASKDKVNPAFKSKYADLGSVVDAIRPVLARHGLAFTQHTSPSEDGVMVETFVRHEGGEKESLGTLFVPANKRDAQGFGSALTYARRYSLMTAFGIPAEDDDGNAAAKSAPLKAVNGNGGKIDDTQFVTLQGLMEGTGSNVQRFCQFFQIPSVKDLPARRYQEAVDAINASAASRRQKEPSQ